jgi:hypothetical protein
VFCTNTDNNVADKDAKVLVQAPSDNNVADKACGGHLQCSAPYHEPVTASLLQHGQGTAHADNVTIANLQSQQHAKTQRVRSEMTRVGHSHPYT